ncbi:hypothetical protein N7495_008170 [Penicillium taxi]|uniref:uncharacterized protein n=1 Tax=Penicillium taxi TaxID=168475 RepID=UPI002545811A|nr:uncharacterized protein N7495_008170 [Penicillium taxi]KAJ5888129.1 hypothetical protein N7495_008170 [Penicillium taxi]
MDDLAHLEIASSDLSAAIERLTAYYRDRRDNQGGSNARPPQLIPIGAPAEAHRARESALASLNKLQVMLAGPTDLLQSLAWQVQTSKGYVSHSELSAAFVTKPSYLDATIFLAETAVSAALDMATTIKQYCDTTERKDGAPSSSAFATISEAEFSRLQRQRQAYLRYGIGHLCDTVTDVLTCLEGIGMSNESTVVEVFCPLSHVSLYVTHVELDEGWHTIHGASSRSRSPISVALLHITTPILHTRQKSQPASPDNYLAPTARITTTNTECGVLHPQFSIPHPGLTICLNGNANNCRAARSSTSPQA